MQIVQQNDVQDKLIEIRGQKVLLNSEVAELYGVETKRINEAVKNNPKKFPEAYLFELSKEEWGRMKLKFPTSFLGGGKVKRPTTSTEKGKIEPVENFDRFNKLKHSTVPIKAFSEKGLYILATILKSPKAIETTIAIIETFAKVRELNSTLQQMQTLPEKPPKQKSLMEHTSDLISDLIISEEDLEITGSETTYEMNFALFKIKK